MKSSGWAETCLNLLSTLKSLSCCIIAGGVFIEYEKIPVKHFERTFAVRCLKYRQTLKMKDKRTRHYMYTIDLKGPRKIKPKNCYGGSDGLSRHVPKIKFIVFAVFVKRSKIGIINKYISVY